MSVHVNLLDVLILVVLIVFFIFMLCKIFGDKKNKKYYPDEIADKIETINKSNDYKVLTASNKDVAKHRYNKQSNEIFID